MTSFVKHDKALFKITPHDIIPSKSRAMYKAARYMADEIGVNPLYALIKYDKHDSLTCSFLKLVADKILCDGLILYKPKYNEIQHMFDYIGCRLMLIDSPDNLEKLVEWMFPLDIVETWYDINRLKYYYTTFKPCCLSPNYTLPPLYYGNRKVPREIIVNDDTIRMLDGGEQILDCYYHLDDVINTDVYREWFKYIKTKKKAADVARSYRSHIRYSVYETFKFLKAPTYAQYEVVNKYIKPITTACLEAWENQYNHDKQVKSKIKFDNVKARRVIARVAIAEIREQHITTKEWVLLNKDRDMVSEHFKEFDTGTLSKSIDCLALVEPEAVADFKRFYHINFLDMSAHRYIEYIIDGYITLYNMYLQGAAPNFNKVLSELNRTNKRGDSNKAIVLERVRKTILRHKRCATTIIPDDELLSGWTVRGIGLSEIGDDLELSSLKFIESKYMPKTEYFMATTISNMLRRDKGIKSLGHGDICHNGKPCDFD